MTRVAVVTGASQGLGLGIARELAARGVNLVLAAHDAAALETAAATIPGALAHVTDVRDPASVDALAQAALEHFGRVDLWLNNAGRAITGNSLLDLVPDVFAAMIDTNLKGAFHGCQSAARAMGEGEGAIWNMLGAGADGEAVPGMNGYATSKAALTFLTRALAAEVPANIAVAGLSPGLVLTEGFFREHARVPADQRAAREAAVNILADTVETIAVWAADLMLAGRPAQAIHNWLTPEKIAERRCAYPPREVLAAAREAHDMTMRREVSGDQP
jgi:NAD(P)-dependent dehydrogenase (short-subunit alcohol dehydrogenase family)